MAEQINYPLALTVSVDWILVAANPENPYAWVKAFVDSLKFALSLIPPGRPKLEATYDEAVIFSDFGSPTLHLLGLGAGQCLSKGIALSDPEAGPWFGPYFAAAVRVEEIIRWHNISAELGALEAQTLTACMHEAGNPPVPANGAIRAVEAAWQAFQAEVHPANDPSRLLFHQLANQANAYPQAGLEIGISSQWLAQNQTPGGPPPPQTPPPPTGDKGSPGHLPNFIIQQLGSILQHEPPGRPIYYQGQFTGSYAASWWDPSNAQLAKVWPGFQLGTLASTPPGPSTINIGLDNGQTVHGQVILRVQFEGGPYPTAHAEFYVDGQLIGTEPAETTNRDRPVTVILYWLTTIVIDGLHTLNVRWVGHLGTVHAQKSTTVNVKNKPEAPPPPPPPPPPPTCPSGYAWNPKTEKCEPIPPIPIPIPWDIWFPPCEEQQKCEDLSAEAIALMQGLANIAAALNQIFRGQNSDTLDPCCHQLIVVITSITTQLHGLLLHFDNAPSINNLLAPLGSIARALADIFKVLETGSGDLQPVVDAIDRLTKATDDCLCKELTRVADALEPGLEDFSDLDAKNKAIQKFLLEQNMTPPELAQIMSG